MTITREKREPVGHDSQPSPCNLEDGLHALETPMNITHVPLIADDVPRETVQIPELTIGVDFGVDCRWHHVRTLLKRYH